MTVSNQYKRNLTKEVNIGNVALGGSNPVCVQTMTNTHTSDVDATVEQCIRCINAGAEYVRITCPSVKDVQYLKEIKEKLKQKGYVSPIIADIHFSPQAALEAAKVVDKVRINPGNYVDKKQVGEINFTEEQYQAEIDKIHANLKPLLQVCKEHNTAIRIGVNHGSLSDRIMSRYGDTPEGMAESAMEFLRICVKENFSQVVISMKASNTIVMVQATRFTAAKMEKENMQFPLHLGVTEAGDGEDGRIKSAAGIGTLLSEGIGDTIRVSLTEEPEMEIPVAKEIVDYFNSINNHPKLPENESSVIDRFNYKRQKTTEVLDFGKRKVPRVIANLQNTSPSLVALSCVGWNLINDRWKFNDMSADYIICDELPESYPAKKGIILPFDIWNVSAKDENVYPLCTAEQLLNLPMDANQVCFVVLGINDITNTAVIELLKVKHNSILIFKGSNINVTNEFNYMYNKLFSEGIEQPVIFSFESNESKLDSFQIQTACKAGRLLIDGLGDGILLSNNNLSVNQHIQTTFSLLQACRLRTYKTEFISCPGCGRTLFELQETTAKIKERTAHLKGLKIGIMGCIVNGPGEMADADYGYVGSGPGKVSLYKNKEVIKRNIKHADAVDELVQLIREQGDWKEKES